MANINEVLKDGQDIFFEPRLQGYLNKKKFFEDNNIEVNYSLEKEFHITNEDKKIIRDYLNGKKNIYDYQQKDNYLDLVDTTNQKFPSHDFKEDERYKRFKKKMSRNKDAIRQRNNYSEWNDGFSKIIPDESNTQLKYVDNPYNNQTINQKFSTPTPDDIYHNQRKQNHQYNGPFNNSSKDNSMSNQYLINNAHNNNHRNIKYNDKNFSNQSYNNGNIFYQEDTKNNNNINKMIGNMNSYANNINNSYQFSSQMDTETKYNKPSLNSNGKTYYNTSKYQPIPFMGNKEGLRDINIESTLRSGEEKQEYQEYRTNGKAKSIGYPNPSEHYFDYISKDIQTAQHTVLPFPRGGENTRQNNSVSARQVHKRDIY